MRMLMRVKIPTDEGNRLVREGKLGTVLRSIIEELKPEAVYFYEDKGERTGLIVADIAEPSQIPRVAEPFFLALNAHVEMHPAMTPQDLAKGEADMQRAAQKYAA